MANSLVRSMFLLSSKASPLVSPAELARIAEDACLDGIDVDGARRAFKFDSAGNGSNVSSVWLSKRSIAQSGQDASLASRLTVVLRSAGRVCIVLPLDDDARFGRPSTESLAFAESLRQHMHSDCRIAFGVRAVTRGGGRTHLDRLRILKSIAGEWDYWIALDLASVADWKWEAEAAVVHAMPRLAMIRVSLPIPTFDGQVQARMTDRTLRTAVQQDFAGIYAIAPSVPPWRWRDCELIARRSADAVTTIRGLMRRRHEAADLPAAPTDQPSTFPFIDRSNDSEWWR